MAATMDDLEIRETVESMLGYGVRVLDVQKKTTFTEEQVLLVNGKRVPLVGRDGDVIRAAMLAGQVPPSELLNELLVRAGILVAPVRVHASSTVTNTTVNRDTVLVSRQGRVVDERVKESKHTELLHTSSTEIWTKVAAAAAAAAAPAPPTPPAAADAPDCPDGRSSAGDCRSSAQIPNGPYHSWPASPSTGPDCPDSGLSSAGQSQSDCRSSASSTAAEPTAPPPPPPPSVQLSSCPVFSGGGAGGEDVVDCRRPSSTIVRHESAPCVSLLLNR